jgi:hypothetical protein
MAAPDVVSLDQARAALTCADALGEHVGDCTKQPQTCMRCERRADAWLTARVAIETIRSEQFSAQIASAVSRRRGPRPKRFPELGLKVAFSTYGAETFSRSPYVGCEGTVVGESQDGNCWIVVWPGSKNRRAISKNFLRFVGGEQAAGVDGQ